MSDIDNIFEKRLKKFPHKKAVFFTTPIAEKGLFDEIMGKKYDWIFRKPSLYDDPKLYYYSLERLEKGWTDATWHDLEIGPRKDLWCEEWDKYTDFPNDIDYEKAQLVQQYIFIEDEKRWTYKQVENNWVDRVYMKM